MDLWIAGILLVIVILVLLLGSKGRRHRKVEVAHAEMRGESPFDILVSEASSAKYAVIDFQTTGLETDEDRIVQAAWLVLDSEYLMMRKGTCLVAQESSGSLEARAVHGLTNEMVCKHGISEEEMIRQLWQDIEDVPILVAHNAEFDLGVFKSSLLRYVPEYVEVLESKDGICTMTDFIDIAKGEKYPSLVELSHRLGCRWTEEMSHHPVAWRNVCLTRICLMKLNVIDAQASDKSSVCSDGN